MPPNLLSIKFKSSLHEKTYHLKNDTSAINQKPCSIIAIWSHWPNLTKGQVNVTIFCWATILIKYIPQFKVNYNNVRSLHYNISHHLQTGINSVITLWILYNLIGFFLILFQYERYRPWSQGPGEIFRAPAFKQICSKGVHKTWKLAPLFNVGSRQNIPDLCMI